MDQIVREIHAAVSVLRSRLGARTVTRGGVVPLIAEGTHAGVRGRRAGPSFSELGSAHGIRYPRERVDAALPVVFAEGDHRALAELDDGEVGARHSAPDGRRSAEGFDTDRRPPKTSQTERCLDTPRVRPPFDEQGR